MGQIVTLGPIMGFLLKTSVVAMCWRRVVIEV